MAHHVNSLYTKVAVESADTLHNHNVKIAESQCNEGRKADTSLLLSRKEGKFLITGIDCQSFLFGFIFVVLKRLNLVLWYP